MRILCLHGVGSSGAILEAQMASLQRELDPIFELVFVDGLFECERGPGVPTYHSGPFYSYTKGYSPGEMADAIDYLDSVLDDEGPFDGIFGFSQGAALTLSYLYEQQAAARPPRVQFACLFSTAMPCSPDGGLGDSIIAKLRALEYDITDRGRWGRADGLTPAEREFVEVLQQTVVDAAVHDAPLPWVNLDVYRSGDSAAIPRVMCPSLLAQKIQVPTIHVWGQNDVSYLVKMAELARSLCDETRAKTVLHGGVHDIPKRPSEIRAVLRTIDWAIGHA